MSKGTATIIGVTGLIGRCLLDEMLQSDSFETIRLLVRRPFSINDPKVEVKLIDFRDHESFKLGIEQSAAVFVAVGTTWKKVKGDKDAYRRVDYDIPVKAAQFCQETGCSKFILVSSVGADATSRNFYLRIKGETEDAIRDIGVPQVHIMRPSILLGDRKEFRMGEKAGRTIMQAVSFLVPPRYRPIRATDVARAMVRASEKEEPGFFVYEYPGMKKLLS